MTNNPDKPAFLCNALSSMWSGHLIHNPQQLHNQKSIEIFGSSFLNMYKHRGVIITQSIVLKILTIDTQ